LNNSNYWETNNLTTDNATEILNYIFPNLILIFNSLDLKSKYYIKYSKCWGSIAPRFSYHLPHRSKNSFLSGVVYLQHFGKDHGDVYFNESSGLRDYYIDKNKIKNLNKYNSNRIQIIPITGTVLIFPSWIEIGFEQNLLPEDSVTLYFDTFLYEHA
jgi:hypothetical protein